MTPSGNKGEAQGVWTLGEWEARERRARALRARTEQGAWRSSILLPPMAMQGHKRGSRCAISRALASSEMSRMEYSFSFVPHLWNWGLVAGISN